MASMSSPHVLIAGGGVSGLCLAQGLRKQGISCAVYEREPANTQRAGYRLTMNADGGEALRACLPEDLYELYLQTSRQTPRRQLAVVIDSQCNELTTQEHLGPPNEGPRPHTAIDRRTLRQIMLGRLGDAVTPGVSATGFDADADGVRLHLSDGSAVEGDLLVGADGIGSPIRRQLLPGAQVVEADVTASLGLFARSPLTPEIVAELPEILWDGFVIARDDQGAMLALGAYVPRQPVAEAAAAIAPDVPVEPVGDYMMISGGVARGVHVPETADWTAGTAEQVRDGMVRAVADWHPALRGLVERLDPGTLFGLRFGRLEPTPAWEPSRVTVMGDAIHAMLPTRGQGANMALRDARVLSEQLGAAARGERPLLEAIGAYEQDMRDYVYPIMDLSADHSRYGGGGLRTGAPAGAGTSATT